MGHLHCCACSWLKLYRVYIEQRPLCLQHPDLIEKRRKVFAERIVRYLRSQQQQDGGGEEGRTQQNGTDGPVRRRPPVARATV